MPNELSLKKLIKTVEKIQEEIAPLSYFSDEDWLALEQIKSILSQKEEKIEYVPAPNPICQRCDFWGKRVGHCLIPGDCPRRPDEPMSQKEPEVRHPTSDKREVSEEEMEELIAEKGNELDDWFRESLDGSYEITLDGCLGFVRGILQKHEAMRRG